MALTQKQSLGGVKIPISYRITEAHADVLHRFHGGRAREDVLAELQRERGAGHAWQAAIDTLRAKRLLVGADASRWAAQVSP
jgi:hypothetical protein